MSVKDFFIAVIKIMAIYFFIVGVLPLVLEAVFLSKTNDLSIVFTFLGVIFLFFALTFFMISHAKTIVKFLGLDKGFSTERFDFSKTDNSSILETAIIIMGLYLVFFTIPYILIDGYTLIKANINSYSFSLGESTATLQQNIITNILYILVGLVMIFLRKPISKVFTTKK